MNFKKIRGRIVITAGVLAMTVVPQAVSAACVQTQNAGEIRQPAYLAACLSDEGSVCSDFGKNRSCGAVSYTHLDVYKRQAVDGAGSFCVQGGKYSV